MAYFETNDSYIALFPWPNFILHKQTSKHRYSSTRRGKFDFGDFYDLIGQLADLCRAFLAACDVLDVGRTCWALVSVDYSYQDDIVCPECLLNAQSTVLTISLHIIDPAVIDLCEINTAVSQTSILFTGIAGSGPYGAETSGFVGDPAAGLDIIAEVMGAASGQGPSTLMESGPWSGH